MAVLTFRIYGLVCACTFDLLCARLEELPGVGQVRIDVRSKELKVCLDQERCSIDQLMAVIQGVGLQVDQPLLQASDAHSHLRVEKTDSAGRYDALCTTT